MITNLDASSELFLANVERIQRRLAGANQQVSSGKKISTAADAPDQIDSLLQLRASRQRNQQIRSNLVLAKADADTADSTLASCIKLMDRAVTLAAQGMNLLQTANSRADLAQQVQGLQEQMVSFSQASVQGRYIFSGDRSDSPAYTFDINAPNAVVQLTSATASSRIEDPAGGSFANSKSAQEIFDPRDVDGAPTVDNVFAVLNNLRVALLNNDTNALSVAIDPLRLASARLNGMQAFYGSVQSHIASAVDYAASYDVRLQSEISEKEDADITSAALELSTANTQLQAAFQMRAGLPHNSLFDYLG
jgi:flagellar hook-associated protein 3 FlgL